MTLAPPHPVTVARHFSVPEARMAVAAPQIDAAAEEPLVLPMPAMRSGRSWFGKLLVVLLVAGAAGTAVLVAVAGTALFLYNPPAPRTHPHGMRLDNRFAENALVADDAAKRVAEVVPAPAAPAQDSAPQATATPAPLAPAPAGSGGPVPLSDPGSRYIIDRATGRIVGIDGSAGAAREEQQRRRSLAANVSPRRAQAVGPLIPSIPDDTNVEVRRAEPVTVEPYAASYGLRVRRAIPVTQPVLEDAPVARQPRENFRVFGFQGDRRGNDPDEQ